MKPSLLPSLVLLALAGHSLALTPIAEKFNGSTLDNNRWQQLNSARGKLVPAKGKLNFVVSANPTLGDYASLELLSSQPGYNESWEMIIDLAHRSTAGKKAGCGFVIFNNDDRRDQLYVEFYGRAGLSCGVRVDDQDAPDGSLSLKAGVPKGSIRVSFNKKTKLLTFDVSLVPASEGYDWKEIGTFSPAGKKGDVRANWNMSPESSSFGIQLYGFGLAQKVAVGKVTLDNFKLSAIP